MVYKYIWISSILCFILSLVLIKIFADGSLFLLLFIFVHLAAFLIMICIAFILEYLNVINDILKYLFSFILSFISIVLIVYFLTGKNIFDNLNEERYLVPFMINLVPYILSNIVSFIFLIFEGRRQRKQPFFIDEGN